MKLMKIKLQYYIIYPNNNIINDNIDQNNIYNDSNRSTNELFNENRLENNLELNNINQNENIFYKYCIKLPYQFILNCCSENRAVSKEDERKLFQLLPNLMDDFVEFCHLIKRKIGIIIFYDGNCVNFLKSLFTQISRSTNIMNLIKENFSIYPVLDNTKDGNKIQDLIIDENNNELLLPAFIFCFNKQNNKNPYLNPILNKNHVIYTLEGETTDINAFYLALKETSNKYLNQNKNDINTSNSLDKSFGLLTDGEILDQQKFEMEELERKTQMKEEQLKQEKKEALEKIVEEPDINNPDATTICFRYPDGERTKNRRFLKSHKIQNLYDYVASLGDEIYTEKENKNFSLYQPFPPKKYEDMENTLEQESLVPNAVIQIREE